MSLVISSLSNFQKKLVFISLIRIDGRQWWLNARTEERWMCYLPVAGFSFWGVQCSSLYILSFTLGSRAIVVRERPGDPHMDSYWTLIYSLI